MRRFAFSAFLALLSVFVLSAAMTVTACGDDDDDDDSTYGDDDAADDDASGDDDADDDDAGDDDADVVDVSIEDMTMNPDPVTIAAGQTVRWTNNDSVPHTTTSGEPDAEDGLWDSGTLDTGDSFSHTFDEAGTFIYFCAVHPDTMTGYEVIVEE
ncbi:MAG: cupredoxin domain-containing protein [Deltaproteobacteria bacterium]|nr:cupredoxin domain-containing protein [Deltaproteobacteria bacterium]